MSGRRTVISSGSLGVVEATDENLMIEAAPIAIEVPSYILEKSAVLAVKHISAAGLAELTTAFNELDNAIARRTPLPWKPLTTDSTEAAYSAHTTNCPLKCMTMHGWTGHSRTHRGCYRHEIKLFNSSFDISAFQHRKSGIGGDEVEHPLHRMRQGTLVCNRFGLKVTR